MENFVSFDVSVVVHSAKFIRVFPYFLYLKGVNIRTGEEVAIKLVFSHFYNTKKGIS